MSELSPAPSPNTLLSCSSVFSSSPDARLESPLPVQKRDDSLSCPDQERIETSASVAGVEPKKPFLRRGSGKARSQPPPGAKQCVASRQLRLRARDSFVEAAQEACKPSETTVAPAKTPQKNKENLRPLGCSQTPVEKPKWDRQFRRDGDTATKLSKQPVFGKADVVSSEFEEGPAAQARQLQQAANLRIAELDGELQRFEVESEIDQRFCALDSEMERFRQGSEALRQLRERSEKAEHELQQERDQLRLELETERNVLKEEVETERQELIAQRKVLEEEANRHRLQAANERLTLRARLDAAREAVTEGERRWRDTLEQLQRQVEDLSVANEGLRKRLHGGPEGGHPAEVREPVPAAAPRVRWAARTSTAVAARWSRQTKKSAATLETPVESCKVFDKRMGQLTENPSPQVAAGISSKKAASTDVAHQTPVESCKVLDEKNGQLTEKPSAQVDPGNSEKNAASTDVAHQKKCREVIFANGLRKVLWPDGRSSVLFPNGDVKESFRDGTVVYHYGSTRTVQTTYLDGTNVYCFANGQLERHCADGSKQVEFPDGTTKVVAADGSEEVVFPDGFVQRAEAPHIGYSEGPSGPEC